MAHPRYRSLAAAAVLAAIVVAGLPATALAHTYTMVTDWTLLERADVVVRGVVRSVDERVVQVGRPMTRYEIGVAEALKGGSGTTIEYLALGGLLADGRRLHIDAEPTFAAGDEVLLFLSFDADGNARLVEFALGAFRVDRAGDRATAYRSLAPALELPGDAARLGGRDWHARRDLSGFAAWIRRQSLSTDRLPPAYLLERQQSAVVLPYSLFMAGGTPLRWRDLGFSFRTRGALAGDASGGVGSAQAGAGAWNGASDLSMSVSAGGGGTQGFDTSDGINSIVFEDPADEIDGTYDCASGGTLAIGGPWYAGNTFAVDGDSFVEILEGDIVVQDGIGCEIAADSAMPAELIGHEIGHAIGIGHSSAGGALMYPYIHADGRGASLHADDLDALDALRYSSGGGGGGGGGGGDPADPADPADPPAPDDPPDDDPVEPPADDPPTIELPAAPRNLGVQVGCGNVVMRWDAPVGGGPVADYVVEIGTSAGGADALATATGDREFGLTQTVAGTYYARVRGRNVTGEGPATGDESYAIEVIATGQPSAAGIVRPARRVNLAFPPLQWQAVCGAGTYQVQVHDADGEQLFDSSRRSFEICDAMGNCSLARQSDTVGPLANGLYRWSVRARNPDGWGDWSGKNFRVQRQRKPRRPRLTSPRNTASINGRVALRWRADEAANLFMLMMRHRPTGTLTEIRLDAVTYCPTPTSCGVLFTSGLAAGTWEWWVVPARDGKSTGRASRHWTFDLAGAASNSAATAAANSAAALEAVLAKAAVPLPNFADPR